MRLYSLFRLTGLLLLAGLASACQSLFEPEPARDPEAIFEHLWHTFDAHYAPFEARGIDWDAVYAVYRPQVTPASSDSELYRALTGMLGVLDDGHVNLSAPDRPVFRSNFWFRELEGDSLFDLQTVQARYLLPGSVLAEDRAFLHGMLEGGIAYVWFDYVGENWNILPELLDRYEDAKGLIVDLRHNQGGDFTYAFSNMGRLTAEDRLIFSSRTKNGRGPEDFTDWYSWTLRQSGPFWDKPLAVLTDRFTISAGERAVMAFRALPQALLIGDTTNGATSTMISGELANGWHYTIATQEVRMFDGKSCEGVGIAPDIRIQNTREGIRQGTDAVLERAAEELRQ